MKFQITGVRGPGQKPITITIDAGDEAEARELAECNDIRVRGVGPAPSNGPAASAVAEPRAVPTTLRVHHRSRVAEFMGPSAAAAPGRVTKATRRWVVWVGGAALALATVAALVARAL